MTPASDLAEGLLNNADRPPVFAEGTKQELYAGGPLPHFNEVDECAGVDALITNRCWTALGLDPQRHCMMFAGATTTRATVWTGSCGYCRFPGQRPRIILPADTRAHAASGNRQCTFPWEEDR